MPVQQMMSIAETVLKLRRREAAQLPELVREVGLVEESAREGELRPIDVARLLGPRVQLAEATDTAKLLRWKSDLHPEHGEEASMAQAELSCDVLN